MNLWRFPEQTVFIPGSSGDDQVCSQNAAGTTGAETGTAASGGNEESVGDYGNSAESVVGNQVTETSNAAKFTMSTIQSAGNSSAGN